MRCIIIEDEAPALQIMEAYARKVPMLEVLAGFRNPIEAVRFLQQNEVDLIFIDINNVKRISKMRSCSRARKCPCIYK